MLWICCKSHETNLQHHTVSNITIEQSSFMYLLSQPLSKKKLSYNYLQNKLWVDLLLVLLCTRIESRKSGVIILLKTSIFTSLLGILIKTHIKEVKQLNCLFTVTQAALTNHSKHFSTAKVLHMPMKFAPIV